MWLIVSPHNPLKKKSNLANDYDRLHLVTLAIGDNVKLRPSNIEFNLPKPSYTIDTLTYLSEKYPDHEFVLIMGGDNLATLGKWKNHELIRSRHQIYVYKRGESTVFDPEMSEVTYFDEVPLLHISSTYVRRLIRQGVSVQYLVPEPVFLYLENSSMYKRTDEKTL